MGNLQGSIVPFAENVARYSEDINDTTHWPYWADGGGNITETADQANDVKGNTTMELINFTVESWSDLICRANVEAGKQYQISFDVIEGTCTDYLIAMYDLNKSELITYYDFSALVSETPTRITTPVFTIPEGCTQIDAQFEASSGGTFYLGRFQLARPGAPYIKTEDSIVESVDQVTGTLSGKGSIKGVVGGFPREGLVAYWKLDDASSDLVVDSLGNHSSTNNTVTVSQDGKIGTSFLFGAGSNVRPDDHADFTFLSDSKATNSAWIYITEHKASGVYMNIMGGALQCFQLHSYGSGTYALNYYNASVEKISDILEYELNTWYHVVFVKDGLNIAWYRNGVNIGETTTTASDANPADWAIGEYVSFPEPFYGRIDEVALWKGYALSENQILALYNSGDGRPYGEFNVSVTGTLTAKAELMGRSRAGIKNGLLGYWSCDDLSGSGTVVDSEGKIDGTVEGYTQQEASKSGLGYSVGSTATMGERIEVPNTDGALNKYRNELTISFWIKVNTNPSGSDVPFGLIWAAPYYSHRHYVYLSLYNGTDLWATARFAQEGASDVAVYQDPTPLSTGTWHHIVGVARGIGQYPKIYIDGVASGEWPNAEQSTWLAQIPGAIRFGSYYSGSDHAPDAYTTEVGLWSRALTEEEIAYLNNSGDGRTYREFNASVTGTLTGKASCSGEIGGGLKNRLMSYWKCDETSGVVIYDAKGTFNHTLLNTASLNEDSKSGFGKCVKFDSNSEYTYCANSEDDFVPGHPQWAISFWINLIALPSTKPFPAYVYRSAGDNVVIYILHTGSYENQLRFLVKQSDGTVKQVNSSVDVTADVWIHYVCVLNQSGLKIYKDGEDVSTGADGWDGGNMLPGNSAYSTYFGGVSTANSYLNGFLDEMCIWDRGVSEAEVLELNNSGDGLLYDDFHTMVTGTLTEGESTGSISGTSSGVATVSGTLKGEGRLQGSVVPFAENIARYSEDIVLSHYPYWQNGSDTIIITPDQANDVKGNKTMELLSYVTQYDNLFSLVGVEEGKTYCASWDVLKGTLTKYYYSVYDKTNSAYIIENANYSSSVLETVTRFTTSEFVIPANCEEISIQIKVWDETGTMYVGRFQVSRLNVPYIKTEDSIVESFDQVTGTIEAKGELGSLSEGVATASGTLVGGSSVAGSSEGLAATSGILEAKGSLIGSMAGEAAVSGTLVGDGALEGSTAGQSTVSGAFTSEGSLSGTSGGEAVVSGAIQGSGSLIGTTGGTSTVTGGLVLGALHASIDGVAIVTGSLIGYGELAASILESISVEGTLGGKVDLSGEIISYAELVGTLEGSGALVGQTDGAADLTGLIVNVAGEDISGTATGSSIVTGSLIVSGVCVLDLQYTSSITDAINKSSGAAINIVENSYITLTK